MPWTIGKPPGRENVREAALPATLLDKTDEKREWVHGPSRPKFHLSVEACFTQLIEIGSRKPAGAKPFTHKEFPLLFAWRNAVAGFLVPLKSSHRDRKAGVADQG